jgi:hypothetical protein
MHVAAALAIGLFALLLLLLVASLSPLIAIPIAVVLALVPIAWVGAAGRLMKERNRMGPRSGVPSSTEASYDPVVDPAERR